MGYSLSIPCRNKERKKALHNWLETYFTPFWSQLLQEGESEHSGVRLHPSYRPANKVCCGFDYNCGGPERYYIWRVAQLITRLSGETHFYYDEEPVSITEDISQEVFSTNEERERMLLLIEAELKRLQALWEANPPIATISC